MLVEVKGLWLTPIKTNPKTPPNAIFSHIQFNWKALRNASEFVKPGRGGTVLVVCFFAGGILL